MAKMMDKEKTKEQLIQELQALRQRVVQLEESESQRKQAEEKLANERNVLLTLIDALPDYIFVKDTECRFVINNEAHIRTLGATTQEEIAGKTDLDIFPPELAAAYYADDQQVIRTGQPLIGREEPTVNKTTGRKQWLLTTKVPLEDAQGEIIGLVGLNRDITELKRVQEEMQRRAVQAELLYDVSRRISGELNLETLLSQIVNVVCTAFDYYGVMLLLLDEETERLTLQAISGAHTHILPQDLSLALGEGMIGYAAATGEPVVSGDVSQDPHYIQKANEKTKSELAVPVKSGQKVVGVIDLQDDQLDAFDETDIMVMKTLADHVAMAIENARLYRAIQQELSERKEAEEALREAHEELEQYAHNMERQAAQFQVASEVTQEAATILDVSQLLNTAVQLISKGFDFYHTGAFLVDEPEEYAVLRAASSESGRRLLKRGHKVKISKASTIGYVAATGEPRIALDVGQDAVFFNDPDLSETRSEMSLPMTVYGRTIGVLDVQSTEEAAFSEDDVTVLQTLANQLAVAVDNARLMERAEAQLRELRLLHGEHRTAIWDGLSPRERSLGYVYDRVDITPTDGLPTPAVDLSLQHGETVALVEPDKALATPLKLRERTIGTLGVQKTNGGREWSPNEVALVEAVSEQVAQALENAQLFAETQKSAQRMQTLYETSRALSSSLKEEDLVYTILDAIFRTLDCEYVLISTVDEKAGTIGVWHGIWDEQFDVFPEWIEAAQYPLDDPDILADIYRKGRTEIIGEWDERFNREIWDTYGHERYLRIFMPIKMRDQVIGVFEASYDKRTKEHISKDEKQTLAAFADQAAVALEHARLFEEAQRHAAWLTAAAEVAGSATAILDVDQLLDETVHLISQQFGFYHAGVFILDDRNEYAVLKAASSEGGQRMLERHHKLPVGKLGIVGHVAGTGKSRIALDVGEDAVHFVNPDLPETRSEMGLPLKVRGQVIGVLDVQSTQEAAFSEDDVAVLQTLADQLAAAIANARLFHEIRTEAMRRALINEVQQAAVASLDPDELLHEVGERLSRRLERSSALFVWEPDEQILCPVAVHDAHAADVIPPDDMRVSRDMHPTLFSEVIDKRHICSLSMCAQDPTDSADAGSTSADIDPDARSTSADARSIPAVIDPVFTTQLGIQNGVYVPLTSRERLLGVLILAQPEEHADDDYVSIDFVENIGVNLSVAWENAQLYQDAVETTEKLREMDRLKSQFLANMSHELRTPLNSIIGFSRVILKGIDGPITDMQRTDLQAVYNSGQHLLGLINDILDISKIQAGKMELTFEDTDVNELIEGVLSTAIALVKDKPIDLQQSVPSDLPTIRADSRRIRQVLLNLVGNAAKFTEEGFIRVQAEAKSSDMIISVSDSGVGIPPEKLETIFEAFTQVDGSSTRSAGGTGLGLSISRHFVELHGGRMWVESTLNEGSTFYVALPIEGLPESTEEPSEEADAADRTSADVDREPESTSTPTEIEEPQDELEDNREVVLCVDDEEGVIKLFRRYLSKSRPGANGGYRVVSLTDSTKVMEKARQLQPFAITLDIMMPEKDGWKIVEELKSDPDTQHIPIIICTIVGDERDHGLSLGAADYLVKPILEDELVAALECLKLGEKHPNRVLIIDDQAEDRSLLRSMIESQDGYEVIEATGGQEAITLIRETKPSIIVLDLIMPDMDGFAVLESIKADESTRSIPIIVVTAKDLTQEERDMINERVESLLQKGLFKQQELLEDVVAALERIRKEST